MWSPPPTVPSSTGLGPFPAPVRRLGFFERLRIGWQLTKVSLSILRREKGLIVLPFLSLLTTGVAWILFFIGIFFLAPTPTNPFGSVFFYAGLAVVYFVTFFVSIYFNAAVMAAAMICLNGGGSTIFGGVAIGGIAGLLVGAGIAVVYWLILGLLGAAAQSILVTALYRYATTGKLGFGFPESLLAGRSQ